MKAIFVLVMTSLILSSGIANAQEPKVIEQWECSDWLSRSDTVIIKLKRMRTKNGHELGKIEVAGTLQETFFRIQGIDRRWDFGTTYEFAFVIKPNQIGLYYDFTGQRGERIKQSQMFRCEQTE